MVEGRICGKSKLRWFYGDRAVYFPFLYLVEKFEVFFCVALNQLLVGSVFAQPVEDYAEFSVVRVVGDSNRVFECVSRYPSLCDTVEKSLSYAWHLVGT